MSPEKTIYSVTEIVSGVKELLESSFPSISIRGELSNLVLHASGHAYFSLKDSGGTIATVLFRDDFRRVPFDLENGLSVVATGRISLYGPQGKFQLIARDLEPAGVGAKQLALEQLKAKLAKEGLFDLDRKKPVPQLPKGLGIITSLQGAALRDILAVLERRHRDIRVIIFPTAVQGENAGADIAQMIQIANAKFANEIDVLLVGRGGGSVEDLWSFNEERVVRAAAASKLPIISCVGHEIDVTLIDFVADVRAPTPSAAAEMVVQSKTELWQSYQELRRRLYDQMESLLFRLESRLKAIIPEIIHLVESRYESQAHRLERAVHLLHSLSPLAVLGRGYSVTRNTANKKVILAASDVQKDDEIEVQCHEGFIYAKVKNTQF